MDIDQTLGECSIFPRPSKFDNEATERGPPRGREYKSDGRTKSGSSFRKDGRSKKALSSRCCSGDDCRWPTLWDYLYWDNPPPASRVHMVLLAKTLPLNQGIQLCRNFRHWTVNFEHIYLSRLKCHNLHQCRPYVFEKLICWSFLPSVSFW